MAKPSVTNIRPPTTPPKTSWDLNSATDQGDSHYQLNTGSSTDGFDTTVATINIPAHGPTFNLQDYNYVFFGVNGGMDETVLGNNSLAGVIVTGNGMDHVTGGQYDDVVFAGNGKDVVDGAGGNDILFGENGADQLNGGSDEGSASITIIPPDPGQGPAPTVTLVDYTPSTDDGTQSPGDGHFILNGAHAGEYQDNSGSLQKTGIAEEGGDFYQVFSFDSADLAPANQLNEVTVAAYIYGPGFSGTPELIDTFTLFENEQVSFSVDMNTHPNGGIVVVFQVPPGGITQTMFDNPNGPNSLKTQAFDGYDAPDGGNGQTTYSFEAGDQLVGGNGPDQFIWNASDTPNVDLIWDYNQSAGGPVDPTEGDTLVLNGVLANLTDTNGDLVINKNDLTTFLFDVDNDANTPDALVIYLGPDQAIGLVGVNNISQVDVVLH